MALMEDCRSVVVLLSRLTDDFVVTEDTGIVLHDLNWLHN